MTVNKSNIEAYLLDYIEGNLDPLLTADLMAFLSENPEYEKYLPDYDGSISLTDTREYTHKELLKKQFADVPGITPENFDEFCIASCEGLLNNRETSRLSEYITLHPENQHDLEIYRKMKLKTDAFIAFPEKDRLKKTHKGLLKFSKIYYAVGSIAASLALLALLLIRKPVLIEDTAALPLRHDSSVTNLHQPPSAVPDETIKSNIVNVPALSDMTEVPETENIATAELKVQEKLQENIQLVAIEPIMPGQLTYVIDEPLLISDDYLVSMDDAGNNSRSNSEGILGSLIKNFNFWKTAKSAIAGFNFLTESQLALEETVDDQGKLTGLIIETEKYTISGNKFK